jgi:HlyD family secretion protein
MATFQINPNATAQQNIERWLISYSYNPDPASPNYVGLPPNFVPMDPIVRDDLGIRVDFIQDEISGKVYVVPRGTANTQNLFSDETIANNQQLQAVLSDITAPIMQLVAAGNSVELVGHSYAGNADDEIARNVIRQLQAGGSTADAIESQLSVVGYNPAPLFNFDPQNKPADSILNLISTNYRMVVPGSTFFPNGLTVGGDAITLAGAIPDPLTLHDIQSFGSANFADARLVSTTGVPRARRADWSRRRNPPSQPPRPVRRMCYPIPHAQLTSRAHPGAELARPFSRRAGRGPEAADYAHRAARGADPQGSNPPYELNQDSTKARQKESYRRLVAPVDGTVQGLKIHTSGAVVTTADTLMTIVPDGTGIEVDCLVPNKDIGFVSEGQDVELKLEAFPFTRYGLVQGRVRKLGRDAATNPNAAPPGSMAAMTQTPTNGTSGAPPAELAYPAKVTLLQDWILVDGRHEQIRAGMRVSAEIKTGDRRVIEYLLSPVMQAVKEAARER